MAKHALIYLSFHEPQRLRLPLQPIPFVAEPDRIRACLFDEEATQFFLQRWIEDICEPYTRLLHGLVANGAKFLVNVSGPLFHSLTQTQNDIAADFLQLLRHPNVSPVCSEARHSISLYLDIELFRREMREAREAITAAIGNIPILAVAPHLGINNETYHIFHQLGFSGIIADGCWDLLRGSSPGYVRRNGAGPHVLIRDGALSLQLAATLSAPTHSAYPLDSSMIARRIIEANVDLVVLGWQVGLLNGETSKSRELTLFEDITYNLLRNGVVFPEISGILSDDQTACLPLPLPAIPTTSVEYGNVFSFFGHPTQKSLFNSMRQAISVARLSGQAELTDLALEMAQWDVLELIHQIVVSNGNAKEPHYLTTAAWNYLGIDGTVSSLHSLYEHFIQTVTQRYL